MVKNVAKYAIVSYNLYCNFTNYGSALQQYALHRVINGLAPGKVEAIVLDYCPDVLRDKDALNPFKNMWDKDAESKRLAELTMPAIRVNYEKFNRFFREQYNLSKRKYTSDNFNESLENENLDGYVCGSDTIWCIQEFGGFDDGYYGYPVMKNSHTISYAASFGDAVFEGEDVETLKSRLGNFIAIGVRETTKLDFIKASIPEIPSQRVLDPTLLLTGADYDSITAEKQLEEPYVLLYSRRYNKAMEEYTDCLAEKLGCKVVEISLRATNADRHIMRYDAGVEEFLSLVKHAEYVVTNSFHGAIFSVQMHKKFVIFSREQCDTKIDELVAWIGLDGRKMVTGNEPINDLIDYDNVEFVLNERRKDSLAYLRKALIAE
jgi:hypothetical protein